MLNPELLSPAALAFVGDGVYSLLVRTSLCDLNRSSGDLHSRAVELVNASAQADAYGRISDMLTEHERDIFRRGRNFHTNTTPKNATNGEYHTATGLEALFGYLYLTGAIERMNELFEVIRKEH